MAGQRLTDKTAATEQLASDDLLMCVDTSDTTGSSVGTSKKIANKYIIQSDILSLNSAQANALNTSPQTLISAPPSGYIIQPLTVTCICTYVSVGNPANYNLYAGYDTVATTTNQWTSLRSFFRNETADRTYILSAAPPADGTFAGTIDAKPFTLWSSGNFSGDWTMKVITTYQIVKL